MIMTDPIADMLTRIRNASRVKKTEIVLPFSTMKFHLAKILEREGFIQNAERVEGSPAATIRILLSYTRGKESVIQHVHKVSTPGHRIYVSHDKIPWIQRGVGVIVLSTSQGLLTDREARKRKIGGELICEVY